MRYLSCSMLMVIFGCRTDSSADISNIEAELEDLQNQINANTETLQSNSSVDVTNLLTQIETLTEENQALAARVTELEEAQEELEGMDYATETWVEDRGYALASTVEILSNTLNNNSAAILANTTTLQSHSDEINSLNLEMLNQSIISSSHTSEITTLNTTVSSHASTITSNSSLLSSHATSIATLEGTTSTMASTLTTHESLISSNTDNISLNVVAIETNADNITANTDSIAAHAVELTSNTNAIGANTSNIGTNTSGIASNASSITNNTLLIDEHALTLDELSVSNTLHYNHFINGNSSDSGILSGRELSFEKTNDASALHIDWFDEFRTYGYAKACRWEIYINGEPCTLPGSIHGDVYVSSTDGSLLNHHRFGVLSGICAETTSGPIPAGPVHITTYVGSTPGYPGSDCYTGWLNVTGMIAVKELPVE